MQSALATLSRQEIAARMRHYAADYVLAGLWHLVPNWQRHGPSSYAHWREGDYEREPLLEDFELYRVTHGGSWFFRGVVRVSPTKPDVPPLSYAFGLALEAKGMRLTRLKPLAGAFNISADAQRRFEERYHLETGRHYGARASTRSILTHSMSEQLTLPGLSAADSEGAE